MSEYTQIFKGTAFSSKSSQEVQILKGYLFCINADGMIAKTVAPDHTDYQKLLHTYQGKENFHHLADGQYFFYLALSIYMSMHHNGTSRNCIRHSTL